MGVGFLISGTLAMEFCYPGAHQKILIPMSGSSDLMNLKADEDYDREAGVQEPTMETKSEEGSKHTSEKIYLSGV
ncbi:hypothetical protein ACMFMF_000111 [Clarireedia jacksonii]